MPKVDRAGDASIARKPAWPFPHITRMTADTARNQWVKRIRGRLQSFGVLSDPKAALERYQVEGPSLHAGIVPDSRIRRDGLTVGEMVAMYCQSKQAAMELGDIRPQTYRDYESAALELVRVFGKNRRVESLKPTDFEKFRAGLNLGPTRRANFITWIRMVFSWAHDSELIDVQPRFGKAFRGGGTTERRKLKHAMGKLMFEPDHLRAIIEQCSVHLRAMVLLGINGGMGNTDVGDLRLKHLKLDEPSPYLDYPRPKTAVERIVPLWPETVEALRASMSQRPEPKAAEYADLVFVTMFGGPWVHWPTDAVAREFRRAIARVAKANKTRSRKRQPAQPVLGFYSLRRTFRTVADSAGDQHAVHRIMGHTIPGMSGVYVQEIKHERLHAVAEHVRRWLFSGGEIASPTESPDEPGLPGPDAVDEAGDADPTRPRR